MFSVTRQQLRDAIEYGIRRAQEPTERDIAALRSVAERADMVATGTFYCGAFGCPLVQAGLAPWNEDHSDVMLPERLCGFYSGFDGHMRGYAYRSGDRSSSDIAEVVG